jgi:hypothetical protein
MTIASKRPASSEPALAYPPRFWWLKRIAIAGALVLVALAGLRWWWGIKSAKLLATEIAAFHARGEPILPEDFAAPQVPDADNGAFYLKQAGEAVDDSAPAPAASNVNYPDYLPFPNFWIPMAQKAVAASRKSLQLAREARRHPQVNWGVKYSTPAFAVLLSHLNVQRNLANLLGDAAVYEHLQHDDAAALDHIEDLLFQVRAIDQEPFLINHLVAAGVQALANHRIELIAPGLTISDGTAPTTASQARPASRAQVRRIIARLLDEQADRDALQRTFRGEQMEQFDTLRWIGGRSVLKPMFELDAVRIARRMRSDIAAVDQPNYPAAKAAFSAPPSGTNLAAPSQLFRLMLTPSLLRATETHFRVVADRRMAAVSLATRLYQIDHGGKYPASLNELVSEYLPYVPLDPLAGNNRRLGYVLAENGKRPIVYSISTNTTDPTQPDMIFPATPMYGWQTGTAAQYRDLSRFTPPTSTQPGTSDQGDSPEAEKN